MSKEGHLQTTFTKNIEMYSISVGYWKFCSLSNGAPFRKLAHFQFSLLIICPLLEAERVAWLSGGGGVRRCPRGGGETLRDAYILG